MSSWPLFEMVLAHNFVGGLARIAAVLLGGRALLQPALVNQLRQMRKLAFSHELVVLAAVSKDIEPMP